MPDSPFSYTPDSPESAIAHRWARAAFNLIRHSGTTHPDALLLRERIGEFWAPLGGYERDMDEIIRLAILSAMDEARSDRTEDDE